MPSRDRDHWSNCGSSLEFSAVHQSPIILHAIDDTDFVAVLEVRADAGQIHSRFDAMPGKLALRTDSGEHQQLRRVEGAAGQNYFPRRARLAPLAPVFSRLRVGAIEIPAFEILDADRTIGVEENSAGERIELDVQFIRPPGGEV